jgi:hypothetical protein
MGEARGADGANTTRRFGSLVVREPFHGIKRIRIARAIACIELRTPSLAWAFLM